MTTRLLAIIACLLSTSAWAAGPDADAFLTSGKFDEGIAALEAHLKQQPKDDTAKFGLGMIRFVQSIQRLANNLKVYGPQTYGIEGMVEVFGSPPAPAEPLTYPQLRKIIQAWLDDLAGVESALAGIEGEDVKLTLHVGRVPLSFGGTRTVSLGPLLTDSFLTTKEEEPDFVIAFDRADVDWLRGYCHVLAAAGEISLAYDGQEWFDGFMHRLFKHAKPRYEFLVEEELKVADDLLDDDEGQIYRIFIDLIAAVHVIRFPVVEPKRMTVALNHIESTLSLSRQMWKLVLGETDDDHEWIPGPKQKGVLDIKVTQDMVDKWTQALAEGELILQGKKLLPFWRGKPGRGLNLRRVFLEPGPLDLILWLQGTAAAPYLEQGELTSPDTWQQINAAFGGEFPGFVLWFN